MDGILDKMSKSNYLYFDIIFSTISALIVYFLYDKENIIITIIPLVLIVIAYILASRVSKYTCFIITIFTVVASVFIISLFFDYELVFYISSIVALVITFTYVGIYNLVKVPDEPKKIPIFQIGFILTILAIFLFKEMELIFNEFIVFLTLIVVMLPYLIHEIIMERSKITNTENNRVRDNNYFRYIILPLLGLLLIFTQFDALLAFIITFCSVTLYSMYR